MVQIRTDPAARPIVSQAAEKALQPGRRRKSSRYRNMNDGFGLMLVAIAILAAVPVASNRPTWWLVWGVVIGAMAMLYAMLGFRYQGGGRRPLQVTLYRWPMALALMVPAYALFQSLPIAAWLPRGLIALPEGMSWAAPPTISALPDASILGALRSLVYLLFLGLVIEVATQQERVRRLAMVLFAGLALHALWGLVALQLLDDLALWGEKTAYLGSLTGTFVNRNSFATFIGMGLLLGLALALDRGEQRRAARGRDDGVRILPGDWIEAVLLWLVLAFMTAALVMTQSRAGVAAVAVGAMVLMMAFRITEGRAPGRILAELGLGLAAILVVAVVLGAQGLVERALFVGIDSGFRSALYAQVLDMIRMRPLTGFGHDAFAVGYDMFRAPPLTQAFELDLAHNSYLALWAESGIVFGSIPMILIALAVVAILRRLIRAEGDRLLNAVALAVVAQGAVHSLVDFSLEVPANVLVFLMILGLALGRERLDRVPADPAKPRPSGRSR